MLDLIDSADRWMPLAHMHGKIHQLPPARAQRVGRRSALVRENPQVLIYQSCKRRRSGLLFCDLSIGADHADSPCSGIDLSGFFSSRRWSLPPRITCSPRIFEVFGASPTSSSTRVFARG